MLKRLPTRVELNKEDVEELDEIQLQLRLQQQQDKPNDDIVMKDSLVKNKDKAKREERIGMN